MTGEILTFRKRGPAWAVYADGYLLGLARRVEDWTSRGNSVRWEASMKGRVVGSAQTRGEAAALLVADRRVRSSA